MKIYLRNSHNFSQKAFDFYNKNFDITQPNDADVIVVNDFEKAYYPNKIVARNSTAIDDIVAKEVISLRGEDLSNFTAVAELTTGMTIYCTRLFKKEEVKDKNALILGYGRIGKQLFRYLIDVGMTPYVIDKENLHQLPELLPISDIVILTITADEDNRNFMNKEKFKMMKDGAIFINPSRGWLVNQNDFKDALDKKLSGAWEDFEGFEHDKLIRTPHLGGATRESREKTELIIAKKLLKLKDKTDAVSNRKK